MQMHKGDRKRTCQNRDGFLLRRKVRLGKSVKDSFHIFTQHTSVLNKLFRTRKYLYISYMRKGKE